MRYHLVLAVAFATSACAEIEFGVPAGGAATGGAGVGGSGTLVGGGAGSPAVGEQCLNGVDDDNDGLADCADDECTEVSCVDIPVGWLGPVELRADDSACSGAFSDEIASLKSAVEAPPAECSCACNGNLLTCDIANLELFADGACGNQTGAEMLLNGDCTPIDTTGVDSYQVTPEENGGGCSIGVDANLPPPTFDARRLCGLSASSAGCDEGACAPSSTCVYMPGNVVCPNGFGTSFMGNATLLDSRSCASAACSCGAPMGGCSFTLEVFTNSNCQGGVESSTTTTGCVAASFAGGGNKRALYTGTIGLVSCPPAGTALPMGGVTLDDPYTVCCAL